MERSFPSGLCPILLLGDVQFLCQIENRDLTSTSRLCVLVPRFVRVKWYSHFERLDCEDGELEANVPLESNGCLNLTRIENMWGIDQCIVSRVYSIVFWLLSFSFDLLLHFASRSILGE